MKPSDFKKIIKEAVKEAIQEELKDILLEAVKAPKMVPVGTGFGTVNESKGTYAQPYIEQPKKLTPSERQAMFGGILEEMQMGKPATTAYNGTFQSQGPVDSVNGALPEGSVGLDQIMALMNGK
jgi:hypothetical protein